MLFRCGKNEDGIGGWFLQSFQEGIEGLLGEHMYLVDDVHTVFTDLGRDADLVHQCLDVLHTVVGGGIQFVDTVGTTLREGFAGLALAARLHICRRIRAVDGLCKNPRRCCLAYSSRAAEQIGVSQLPAYNGILEGSGNRVLSNERLEGVRPVLSRRYYIL